MPQYGGICIMNPIKKHLWEGTVNHATVSRNLYNEPYMRTENHTQYRGICVMNPIT